MADFVRYDPTDIHWKLIERTRRIGPSDRPVADDGWVMAQALFCPYYSPLEGELGGDWGVILNPESVKFARLVFEHDWCGCPGAGPNQYSDHGCGDQLTDEWALPRSQRKHYRRNLRLIKKVRALRASGI